MEVYLRGHDKPIIMPTKGGLSLMEYLTQKDISTVHVSITDIDGSVLLLNRHEIRMIHPVPEDSSIPDDLSQLKVPE